MPTERRGVGDFIRDQWTDATDGGIRSWGWEQWLDAITEPWVPGNFYNNQEGRGSTFAEIFGLGGDNGMFGGLFGGNSPGFSPRPGMGIAPVVPGTPTQQPQAWVDGTPRYSWEENYGEGYMDARVRPESETSPAGPRTQAEVRAAYNAQRQAEKTAAHQRSQALTNLAMSVSGLNATSLGFEQLNEFGRKIAK